MFKAKILKPLESTTDIKIDATKNQPELEQTNTISKCVHTVETLKHHGNEPAAPAAAVVVNHLWETRESFPACPVHVWLSH